MTSATKKLFSLIKDRKCDSSGISPLKKDDIQKDDPREKADILNDKFSSVFKQEHGTETPDLGPIVIPDLPTINITPKGDEKTNLSWTCLVSGLWVSNIPRYFCFAWKTSVSAGVICSYVSHSRRMVSSSGTLALCGLKPDIWLKHIQGEWTSISCLNPQKASGPDELPIRLLRETSEQITPSLTLVFQASLHQGPTPSDWNKATVTPIFKKADKSKPPNYRPVSFTSGSYKVLEHIIHSSIMQFFDHHNILFDMQHGFRKSRSCESQLILTIQDLAKGIDDKAQIDAVLLDFSQAFDKVPHNRLVSKLHYYGICGWTLSWIHSFLANRTKLVAVEGVMSDSALVTGY